MPESITDIMPKKFSALAIGPPRSAKSLFSYQFMADGLMRGEDIIYFVTNNFPENVIGRIFGDMKNIKAENMKIVDCYTIHAGIDKGSDDYVIRVSGPYALNEISIAATKAMKSVKAPIRVVFDTFSTLLLYNNLWQIEEFLNHNIGKLKAKDASIILMLEEGMHDKKDISLLESLTDGTIEFNVGEKLINFRSISEEKSIKYSIDSNKLVAEKEIA